MTPPGAHPVATHHGVRAAWRRNGLVWLMLLVLQAASIGIAFLPIGRWAFPMNIAIAAVEAAVVGVFSMNLDRATPLDRLAAAAGFLFVGVMFAITLSDILTRL